MKLLFFILGIFTLCVELAALQICLGKHEKELKELLEKHPNISIQQFFIALSQLILISTLITFIFGLM